MSEVLVGIILDTHGLVRPEAVRALKGSELLIPAGDIGNPQVIEQLHEIAPIFVVRGNNDRGAWAAGLPVTQMVEVGELLFYTTWKVIGYGIDPLKNISLLNQLVTKKTLKGSSANFFRTFNGLRLTFQVVRLTDQARPGPRISCSNSYWG